MCPYEGHVVSWKVPPKLSLHQSNCIKNYMSSHFDIGAAQQYHVTFVIVYVGTVTFEIH